MQKKATRAVGGIATAGVLVAGVGGAVAASFVAGFFTFGIGTVVGLSVTAAVSAVAGTGAAAATGAATPFIVLDRKKLERDFRTMLQSFRQVESHTTRVEDFINTLQNNAGGIGIRFNRQCYSNQCI